MKQEFYPIYKDLSNLLESTATGFPYFGLFGSPRLSRVVRNPLARRGARWVSESIDAAVGDSEMQIQLRPDAKHFLITNFYEMVVLPLCHPDNPLPIQGEELRSAIFQDVRTLVMTAEKQRQEEEITGAEILRVTAESLDSLQISQFRFWGPREKSEFQLWEPEEREPEENA